MRDHGSQALLMAGAMQISNFFGSTLLAVPARVRQAYGSRLTSQNAIPLPERLLGGDAAIDLRERSMVLTHQAVEKLLVDMLHVGTAEVTE